MNHLLATPAEWDNHYNRGLELTPCACCLEQFTYGQLLTFAKKEVCEDCHKELETDKELLKTFLSHN